MNDDELRRFLQNALGGRRMPDDARDRILSGRRRPSAILRWASFASAAALLVAAAAWVLVRSRASLPSAVEVAFEGHARSEAYRHAVASSTPREIASTLSDATGRAVELPALRDHGFVQLEAHRCADTGTAHVIYANSWLKLSCFLYEAAQFPRAAGERLANQLVDGTTFVKGKTSAVAIREGGVVKLWVSDLRLEQLAAIAVDAEQKRYQMATTVLSIPDDATARPMGAVLSGMPGVEEVQVEEERREFHVKYDPRSLTLDEIVAVLQTSGIEASPREWAGSEKK
jgi:hypothetical protein